MSSKSKKYQERVNLFLRIILFFTIGSFLGCIFETILCLFQRGALESRQGVIYGPFNPIYGLAIALAVFVLEKQKKNSTIIISGALLGGIIEYICSWVQEIVFKTTSWNYSNYFLNFHGRTSLYHMIWWGILGFLFMKFIYPHAVNLFYKIKEKDRLIVAIILTVFFTIDILISGAACLRQRERIEGKKADNVIAVLLDKYYSDEFLSKIYPNARDAKTHQKINQMK